MKHFLVIIIILLFSTKAFTQTDSTKRPEIWLRPYLETGVSFLSNDALKTAYSTNSMFNWGVGLRVGNPNKNNVLPYFQYSNSSFTTENVNEADSVLINKALILGTNVVVKSFGANCVSAKVAYIHATIEDDVFVNSGSAHGIQFGLGYEANVFRNSRVFVNYTYDFLKYSKSAFRDYDTQKLTVGFIL